MANRSFPLLIVRLMEFIVYLFDGAEMKQRIGLYISWIVAGSSF